MDPTGQRGEPGQAGEVGLAVEVGLVEVGHGPALGDVDAEGAGQLVGRGGGRRVAPGPERYEPLVVLVEGQVAVHHRRDAHGGDRAQPDAVGGRDIVQQVRDARADAGVDLVAGVGPVSVLEVALPRVGAGSQPDARWVGEDRLDPRGAELDAENGLPGGERVSGAPLIGWASMRAQTFHEHEGQVSVDIHEC